MSRGREAVRAANRRTEEARAEAEALRAELAEFRAARKKETDELYSEIKRLKADHMTEASRIAAEEVTRQLAEKEEAAKKAGLSTDVAHNLLYLKDKFVFNACRYISMTTGVRPEYALYLVIPWMTDEDLAGILNPAGLVVKLGLPSDGWVARLLKANRHHYRGQARRFAKRGKVFPRLGDSDEFAQLADQDIHPRYDPRWYAVRLEYRGMELIDDEPEAAAG